MLRPVSIYGGVRMSCSFHRRQRSWLAAIVSGMTVITLVPTTVAHASEAQLPEGPSSSSATPSPGNHAMGSQIKKHEHGAVTANRMQSLATDTELEGMDVSSEDGNVDWPAKVSSGMSFAWVKATEGTSYQNSFYASQYNGSQSAGLVRGAYHFALPSSSSGQDQATYFSDHGGGWSRDGYTLPGVVDLEYNPYGENACYGLSQTAMASWIRDFVSTYQNRWGRAPMIYTSTSWWNRCVGSAASDITAVAPLWIARYSSTVGELPSGWDAWATWQYSDTDYDMTGWPELTQTSWNSRPTEPRSRVVSPCFSVVFLLTTTTAKIHPEAPPPSRDSRRRHYEPRGHGLSCPDFTNCGSVF